MHNETLRNIAPTPKAREPWLDYVRFLSIFLVILYHTPPQSPILDGKIIVNLRVPVFFCVSGFLFRMGRYSSFGHFFRHRGKQILVPYATFFLLFYALWLTVGRRIGGPSEMAIDPLLPLKEFVLGTPETVVGPFWYIACLLSMQVLYYFLRRMLSARQVFAVSVVAAVGTAMAVEHLEWFVMPKFWNIDNAVLFMPFYAAGNCFKDYIKCLHFSPRSTPAYLTLAVVSMAVMVWSYYAESSTVVKSVKIACGLAILPAYLAAGKAAAARWKRNRIIELVVMNGTVYLALQNNLIAVIKVILNKLLYTGVMDDHLWMKFAVALVVMIAIYPFAWLIHHHAPWMLGKSKQDLA